jgi:hypothetical protein
MFRIMRGSGVCATVENIEILAEYNPTEFSFPAFAYLWCF